MEFQRIHRVGKKNTSSGKPRQIIARFLRYPDREEVKKMQRFRKAKEEGKTVYFSRSEPDKLYKDGVEV